MEYILKTAEEIDQQWAHLQQQQEDIAGNYKSIFTINGKSILSPLMTPEKRLEMQQHRQAALDVEKQVALLSKFSHRVKTLKPEADSGCRQFVDASTNTEQLPKLPPQPLTVIGRFKQQLRMSETLVYDNKCNAIIKFSKPPLVQSVGLCEEYQQLAPQCAVVQVDKPKIATLSAYSLETTEPKSNPGASPLQPNQQSASKQSIPSSRLELIKTTRAKSPTKDQASIRQPMGHWSRKLNNQTERKPLQRSSTSPALPSTQNQAQNDASNMDDYERLHPQLWKRYHSNPIGYKSNTAERVAPTSPNMALVLPCVASTPISKIQVKQQHSLSEQLDSKSAQGSQQKLSGAKTSKRTPCHAYSHVRYAAHAHSHANADSDCSTRISSTQRRLSYDPRANIKRAAALKKVSSSSSCSIPPTAKLLDEMERQQRKRFQLLVSQQADEQQRLQAEFQAQQQQLIDQMVYDMNSVSCDKDGQLDHANSECSSVGSLPQSRLDVDVEEPDRSGI